jgi:hypothetical protein
MEIKEFLRKSGVRFEDLLAEALKHRKLKLGEDHPDTLESLHDFGVMYLEQARYEDAEPLLLLAFQGRETKLGPQHPRTIDSLKQLVSLYELWGKPDEAERWRAKLGEMKAAEK